MNFSPLFYQVQDFIKKDNIIEFENLFNDLQKITELNSYYEDFIHCTYPNSFKCLKFLIENFSMQYDVHSVLTQSFKDNNTLWVKKYLDFFKIQYNITQKDNLKNYNNSLRIIINININFDYNSLYKSSKEMWNILFQYKDIRFFKSEMLLREILDNKNWDKLSWLEELCEKNKVNFPLKDLFTSLFSQKNIEKSQYYFNKYKPKFNTSEIDDLIESVGLYANKKIFKFFTDNILPFNHFSNKNISACFNMGLDNSNTLFIQYLKNYHSIDFYQMSP